MIFLIVYELLININSEGVLAFQIVFLAAYSVFKSQTAPKEPFG